MDNSILRDLKDQLFDAPSDVKSAFNDIVAYFDDEKPEKKYRFWMVGINRSTGNPEIKPLMSRAEAMVDLGLTRWHVYDKKKDAEKKLKELLGE